MEKSKKRHRAAWGSITRKQVVDAAERAVRADGFEEISIRRLAADLGVAPMSLYQHVRDKDDLLEEVVDRLLVRRWRPRVNDGDWMAWVGEAAQRFRDFLISEPAALHVYLRHPVASPVAIARMNAFLAVLKGHGFDDAFACRVYGAIHTYTIGFAALEASRARAAPKDPIVNEMVELLATFTSSQQFKEGLTYLLNGIESQRVCLDTS